LFDLPGQRLRGASVVGGGLLRPVDPAGGLHQQRTDDRQHHHQRDRRGEKPPVRRR
jgi:hypothetical protein